MFRRVVIGGLVEKFGELAKHYKTMGKACRHPQLALVLGGQ